MQIRRTIETAILILPLFGASAIAQPAGERPAPIAGASLVIEAQARSCKSVSSCREAVELWCSGYRRADGDGDGIPCENVCRSKEEVDRLREEIGC